MAKTVEERRADKAAYMRQQRAQHPDKYREKSRAFTSKHRDRLCVERNAKYALTKKAVRASRRGVPVELIEALLVKQNGACPVCKKPLAPWPSQATHIDHCHDTGAVRGLLCASCNQKEGWVRRYGEALQAYLSAPPAAELLGFA